MMAFYGLYPTWKPSLNISERIKMKCIDLESLLNQLEPQIVFTEHLTSLKQALFHSHTKVVQVTVKQFIRLASDKKLAEQLSGDMEVVLGLIENLAHKDLRVARDCVMMLLLLSCSPKAIMNLLCPDITDVLKTIMTYVAVRILVYEFILQLSINSSIGLEKSYSCGILEDVINDFKNKESYLTTVHYHQLHTLAATSHGHHYLVKYDAVDAVPKHAPDVTNEIMTHLIQVVPEDFSIPKENSKDSHENKQKQISIVKPIKENSVQHCNLPGVSTVYQNKKKITTSLTEQFHKSSSSTKDSCESTSKLEKCLSSVRSSSPSSDSSTISRKQDDSSNLTDRSFTPPLDILVLLCVGCCAPLRVISFKFAAVITDAERGSVAAYTNWLYNIGWEATESLIQSPFVRLNKLQKLVANMKEVIPHELFTVYPDALEIVLRAVESSDRQTVLLALQVVAYVGSTVHGKRILYKLSKKERFMSTIMRKILNFVKHSSAEHVTEALNVFFTLINISEASVKYEKITRKWFRQMGRPQEILEIIIMLSQQSPESTQIAAHKVLQALCGQEWGLHYIRGRKGLLDVLLIDSNDESEAICQIKIIALELLLMSPLAGKMFKPQTLKQIQNYIHKCKSRL